VSKQLSCFAYYGGKFSKLDWLLPQLETAHATYCELFAGSLAVLLNKPPARCEIVNDLAGEIADFWATLRDHNDALIRAINLTPAGEAEFLRCINAPPTDDVVERARRFYVFITQAFSSVPVRYKTRTSFTHSLRFVSRQKSLRDIAERLRGVIVENTDACRVLRRVSASAGKPILFYADPPYPLETRQRKDAYLEDDFNHEAFLDAVLRAPDFCKFAISGYPNNLYDSRLAGWHRAELNTRVTSNIGVKNRKDDRRTEVLWRNYELQHNQTVIGL